MGLLFASPSLLLRGGKGHSLLQWLLECVALLDKLLYLSLQSIKLLSLREVGLHLFILFFDDPFDPFLLLGWHIEHALRQYNVLKLLLSKEIEEIVALWVAILQT